MSIPHRRAVGECSFSDFDVRSEIWCRTQEQRHKAQESKIFSYSVIVPQVERTVRCDQSSPGESSLNCTHREILFCSVQKFHSNPFHLEGFDLMNKLCDHTAHNFMCTLFASVNLRDKKGALRKSIQQRKKGHVHPRCQRMGARQEEFDRAKRIRKFP